MPEQPKLSAQEADARLPPRVSSAQAHSGVLTDFEVVALDANASASDVETAFIAHDKGEATCRCAWVEGRGPRLSELAIVPFG